MLKVIILIASSIVVWLILDLHALLSKISYFTNIIWYLMTIRIVPCNNKDIARLYVTSRKALRVIWRLPYQTHSVLLPYISGIPPLDICLGMRCLKHVHTGFNHDNSLAKFVFQNSIYNIFLL